MNLTDFHVPYPAPQQKHILPIHVHMHMLGTRTQPERGGNRETCELCAVLHSYCNTMVFSKASMEGSTRSHEHRSQKHREHFENIIDSVNGGAPNQYYLLRETLLQITSLWKLAPIPPKFLFPLLLLLFPSRGVRHKVGSLNSTQCSSVQHSRQEITA